MKVIVFGASGKTGELVVEKALAAGHQVSVFAHSAAATFPAGVQVFLGDAQDDVAVRAAITGHNAVIDTIGGKTPYKSTDLETTAVRNIISGMSAERGQRLIVVSMLGLGESTENTPFWYEFLLMPTFLHGSTKDKAAMEGVVKASDLDFVIVRPPILTDGPATGSVKVIGGHDVGHKITRADLAQFLVDQLTTDENLNQAVVVANS